MAKIAGKASAARKRKSSTRRKATTTKSKTQQSKAKKKVHRKSKTSTTARASKKVAVKAHRRDACATGSQPAQPSPPPDSSEVQDDQHDVLDDSDMEAITAEMCREIENAVLLINCLMPLKRMAHVVDACACPYDPKDNPPDWCLIIHGRMWSQLENVITRINDAIGLRMKRVTEIIGAKHLTEEQWRRT